MQPEGSLPYSQVPATCPYPELTPSSPHDPLQNPVPYAVVMCSSLKVHSKNTQCTAIEFYTTH
jgi:hypothetical protein